MTWEKVNLYRQQAQDLRKETFNPEAFFKLQEIEAAITILITALTGK